MASFRDARPPKATALLFIALLAFQPLAARASLLNGSKLASLFRSDASQAASELLNGLSLNPLNPFATIATEQFPSFDLGDISQFADNTFNTITGDVRGLVDPGPLSPDFQKLLKDANGDPNSTETANAVATLALLSAIFNTVSAILYTVSGGLATAASSLALIPASLALVTGPAGFVLSAEAFAYSLRSDFKANSDRLYSSFSAALTAVAARLQDISNGNATTSIGGLRTQIAQAKDLVKDAISKHGINVTLSG